MDRHEWAARTLSVRPGDRVLEIGCGHGVTASYVCAELAAGPREAPARFTGLDRSAKMTAAAGRRNAAHVAAGLAEFRTGAVPAVPAAELAAGRPFDVAYAFNVRLLWTDPAAARAVAGLLRPGGRLSVFFQLPSWSAAAHREVAERAARTLTAGGLAVTADAQDKAVESGYVTARTAPG
ncbi:methyltransferase domain-containing protein [Streptomyces sp. WMMC500]|uniref:SAM-dependent methyltransferase n=1 Tax=Streptomyces sp. WMMC500 TaxID=3015154 RepID=UPI00248CC8B3|nr:methyltransferase domain-containing protein [Streptomyces sp. WMMC500]WBB62197.1 methyltransferase domain-containing protein [Streptomyces sp. WMMC500]